MITALDNCGYTGLYSLYYQYVFYLYISFYLKDFLYERMAEKKIMDHDNSF